MQPRWMEISDTYECLALIGRRVNNSSDDSGEAWEGTGFFRADMRERYPECGVLLKRCLDPIEEVGEFVFSRLTASPEELDFFFRQDVCGFRSVADRLETLWERNLRPGLLSPAEWSGVTLRLAALLATGAAFEPSFVVPETESELLTLLDGSAGTAHRKWKLALLFHNAARYQARVHEILSEAAALYREKKPLLLPLLEEAKGAIQARLERNPEEYRLCRFGLKQADFAEIAVSAMGYDVVSYVCPEVTCGIKGYPDLLAVGILIEPLALLRERREDGSARLTEKLRALSDRKRLDVLRALKERSLCGQELAELLKVTPATVSHHMNLLLEQGFVVMEKEGTRINYSLQNRKLSELLAELGQFLLP